MNKVTSAISSHFFSRLGNTENENKTSPSTNDWNQKTPNPSIASLVDWRVFSRDLGSHQVVSCRQQKEDRSHSNELGVWLGDVCGANQRMASRWHWFIRIYLKNWKRTKSWHGWMAVLISNLSLPFVKIWNHHSNDSWTRFLVKYMVLVTSKELFVFPMPPRHCQ